MFGDTYPNKYMVKTTDTLIRMNFGNYKILHFGHNLESKLELSMLVSDFMVNFVLKTTHRNFY